MPGPEIGWKGRAARAVTRLPGLRSGRVGDAYLRARRAQRRRARHRAEARGDRRLSRPSLHQMADRLDAYLDLDGGFFVEAGANDGFEQSNTYHLERFRGWRGLLVEPIPELYREAVAERPASTVVNCALVPFDHPETTVEMRYGNLMSTVVGAHGSDADERAYVAPAFLLGLERERKVRVPARPLSAVLDEIDAPEIDFMSLDVEGFEAQVLRGLDLTRHAPRFLLVELNERREDIEAILGERYVAVEQLTPGDVLYARSDQDVAARSLAA